MASHSSIDIGEDFMAHYGVKGMHWGIRNDGLSEEDRKWKKSGVSKAERKAAVNAAKEDFSKAIVEVNAKPEHQSIPMDQYGAESGFEPPSVRKYYDEVLTVAQRSFDKASLRFPPSPSGKLRFRLVANSPYGWTGTTALDDHVFWDLEVVDSSVLEHSVSGEFLSHFGVKGMHWGIRRDRENGGHPKRMLGYDVDKATLKRELPSFRHPIARVRYLNAHRTTANKAALYGFLAAFGGLSFYAAMHDTTIIGMGRDFVRNLSDR